MGGIFPGQGEGTQIGNNQGIHPGVVQLLQIGGQLGDFLISGHGVYRHMTGYTVFMGEFHSGRNFLRGEISGKGAHTEVRSCQIDGIRAVENGHFQPFHIPRRGEKLQFFHTPYLRAATNALCSSRVTENLWLPVEGSKT